MEKILDNTELEELNGPGCLCRRAISRGRPETHHKEERSNKVVLKGYPGASGCLPENRQVPVKAERWVTVEPEPWVEVWNLITPLFLLWLASH